MEIIKAETPKKAFEIIDKYITGNLDGTEIVLYTEQWKDISIQYDKWLVEQRNYYWKKTDKDDHIFYSGYTDTLYISSDKGICWCPNLIIEI